MTLDTKSFKDQNTCITLAAKITIVSFILGKNVATIIVLTTITVFRGFRIFSLFFPEIRLPLDLIVSFSLRKTHSHYSGFGYDCGC